MPTKANRAVWNTRRPFVFFAYLSFFLLLSFSCTTTGPSASLPPPDSVAPPPQVKPAAQSAHIRSGVDFYPDEWQWEDVAPGVRYLFFGSASVPLRWHMVSLDLHSPALELTAYPSPEEMDERGTFSGKTTWQFLDDTDALVAVNASPFAAPLTRLFPQRRLVGLYINHEEILSPPVSRYSAICFSKKDGSFSAAVIPDQTLYPLGTEFAFGGFFTILADGAIQDFPGHSLDSRLALGTAEDGRYLFILYVEGEDKRESLGLSYEESALVMRQAGVWNALQMDGGGSASLSVRGKNITGKAHRKAGNILGFTLSFQ